MNFDNAIRALAGTLVLAACGGNDHRSLTGLDFGGQPAAVRIQSVALLPYRATEEVVGTVRSKQRAVVEAKISGRIEQFLAAPGQLVKASDLLAQLDVREVQAKVDQAKAVLDQANKDLQRYTALLASNAVTRQEFDAVVARQKVAAAGVTETETMLGYARVTAPFDGVITRKLGEVGDLAAPGRPLLEVESPAALRFEADLPEALVDQVKIGAVMPVRVSALKQSLDATVSEIAPVADAVSRTFLVKFDLPQTSGLRAGQFGRVAIPVSETRMIRVPSIAVIKRGQMEIVFVLADGKAALRLVKTGKHFDGAVEIVAGLNEGEQIVIEGAADLRDGQLLQALP